MFTCFCASKQTMWRFAIYMLFFNAITAQTIVMNMTHILLPKSTSLHACGANSSPANSIKAKPYCCCYFIFSVFRVYFSSVCSPCTWLKYSCNKGKIETKKLIFNLKYLTKQKHKYTTWLACKAAKMIFVRVATSTSNSKSNNISTHERPNTAK